MGQDSTIEWTHHTFNPWHGCVHVSPACDHCYAEGQARYVLPAGWLVIGEDDGEAPRLTRHGDPDRPDIWGADAPRIFPPPHSPVHTAPLAWNRKAAACGERHRVFAASMADIFERHRRATVNAAMDRSRGHLFSTLIPKCASLDFLLLTKRPHDVTRLVPVAWHERWPDNAWAGTTVEDQQRAVQRLPHLIETPAPVRFVSVEPLLGPLDLRPWLGHLDWVIAGGESGAGSRPMQIEWVRSVRDQCVAAGVAFFMKQWGNHAPDASGERLVRLRTKNERLLDGREWNQLPIPRRRGNAG